MSLPSSKSSNSQTSKTWGFVLSHVVQSGSEVASNSAWWWVSAAGQLIRMRGAFDQNIDCTKQRWPREEYLWKQLENLWEQLQIPRKNAYVSYAPGIAAIAWPCLTASSSVRLRHDGNPSIWPACAAFAFLFLVPKILEKFVFSSTKLSTLTFSEPSVNAVDVVRAIAIWYSTFASFQSFSTQKFTARITGRDTKSKICVADFLFESGPKSKNYALDLTPRTQVYFHLAWQTAFICLERFCFKTTNTTCLRNTVFRNRNMYRNIMYTYIYIT